MRQAKAPAQSDQSSHGALWVAKVLKRRYADGGVSDQTALRLRMIWDFFGYTCNLVGYIVPWLKFILKESHSGEQWHILKYVQ